MSAVWWPRLASLNIAIIALCMSATEMELFLKAQQQHSLRTLWSQPVKSPLPHTSCWLVLFTNPISSTTSIPELNCSLIAYGQWLAWTYASYFEISYNSSRTKRIWCTITLQRAAFRGRSFISQVLFMIVATFSYSEFHRFLFFVLNSWLVLRLFAYDHLDIMKNLWEWGTKLTWRSNDGHEEWW